MPRIASAHVRTRPARWAPLCLVVAAAALALSCGGNGSGNGRSSPVAVGEEAITDSVRSEALEGDGRPPDSSTGIWEGTLNLLENGGFEQDLTGWAPIDNAALDGNLDDAKFGTVSLRIEATAAGDASVAGRNVNDTLMTVDPEEAYALSVWLKRGSGAGDVRIGIAWFGPGDTIRSDMSEPLDVGAGWTRHFHVTEAPAGASAARVEIAFDAQPGDVLLLDGAQLEDKPFPTPYVDTGGIRESRLSASVSFSADALTPEQGWVAARLRMGWDNQTMEPNGGTGFPRIIEWGNGGPDRITIFYGERRDVFGMHRRAGDIPYEAITTVSFAHGDPMTVIAYWLPTEVGISAGGSQFEVLAGDQAIPDLSHFSRVQIGSYSDTNHLDADVLWFAAGTGTITSEDIQRLNDAGDADPTEEDFSPEAGLTLIWTGE